MWNRPANSDAMMGERPLWKASSQGEGKVSWYALR